MSDLVKIARARVTDIQQTHWEGCERDHRECLIQRMADEIERLTAERDELRRQPPRRHDPRSVRRRWHDRPCRRPIAAARDPGRTEPGICRHGTSADSWGQPALCGRRDSMTDSHEIAWAAGLFDGEGTTFASARRPAIASDDWNSRCLPRSMVPDLLTIAETAERLRDGPGSPA